MGYVIAALIVIFLLVELIRLIVSVLSRVAHGLATAADKVGHVLAWITPRLALVLGAVIVLWAAAWLASELWYLVRDRRAERRWFSEIGPRIAVAMAPGGPYTVVGAPPLPRLAAFGHGSAHTLTPPVPGWLQGLADHLSPEPEPEPPFEGDYQPPRAAAALAIGPAAAGSATLSSRARDRSTDGPAEPSGLRVLAQLDRLREIARETGGLTITTWGMAEPMAPAERAGDEAPERGRLIVVGSRGVQVGSHNRQVDIYTYEIETPRLADLLDRLNDPDVAEAARRLASNPHDAAARRELVDRIAPGGLFLGRTPTGLRGTAAEAVYGENGSWLDGTVIFRNVAGGQVGDQNVQRNEFTYVVVPTDSARQLLAKNRVLARELVDGAFPARGQAEFHQLAARLRSTLEGGRVERQGGPARAEHHEFPAPGETLRIRDHHGVSVGKCSTIESREQVEARRPASASSTALSQMIIAIRERDRAAAEREAIADREAAEDPANGRAWRGPAAREPGIGGLW